MGEQKRGPRYGIIIVISSSIATFVSQMIDRSVPVHAEARPLIAESGEGLEGRSIAPSVARNGLDSTQDEPRNHGREVEAGLPEGPSEETHLPKAIASFEGIAAPGLQISLKSEGTERATAFKWVQVAGPEVILNDPTGSDPRFVVPDDQGVLGFLLVATNGAGADVARISIPVEGRREESDGVLRPDAGDDQIGIVGRQITLNGLRSEPRGQLNFRWIQVAGPEVRLEMTDGAIYSFVPQAPGVYQFALLVATAGQISEPDYVSVSVGNPASSFGIDATPEPPTSLHDLARALLGQVPGGLEVAQPLAEAFDGVADRMDLYRSYDEAFLELGRRLEGLLPPDVTRRGVWEERLFVPLTAKLIDGMRAEGLELRHPEARASELNLNQRARLAELFRAMAKGFRATQPGL